MNTAPNVKIIPAKIQTAENRNRFRQLRVAAYCRVSTEQEEQQNSYQVQIAYYTDLINRKKEWTLAGIFADEGISGTQTKKRTEFNRMIRMCRNKKIDLVITKSISRFARNTVDCLQYVRQLKDLGIGVIFEKENINTLTMTSEFMIALYGSFAQAESESISKNVSWGKEKAYRNGKVPFQYKHLLGYKKGADGKPEIVPDEAETVRAIYDLFLDGFSMTDIANKLTLSGRKTAHGNTEWHREIVRSILRNEKYALSELLICGSCGTPYRRQIWKSNGNRYAVWRCISRLEHGKRYCTSSPTLKETVLEKAIINAVNEYFGCRDEIAEILKANIGSVLEYQGQDEIISIENRLKEIDRSRNDLIGLIASGGCDEDKLDGEFAKIYMEEQSLKEQKEDLKEKMRLSADTQDKIDSAMDMIKNESLRLEFFDNVIIRKLVECIKVKSKTELLIIFKGGIEVQAEMK
jgi:DNA invertase Pin-like site-specific DNA recombinase